MPTKFCSELRDRAVRMVYDRHALESGPGAQSTRAVAPELGVGEEPLRSWCNRYGPAERSSRVGGHGKMPSDGHVVARWRS